MLSSHLQVSSSFVNNENKIMGVSGKMHFILGVEHTCFLQQQIRRMVFSLLLIFFTDFSFLPHLTDRSQKREVLTKYCKSPE